MGDDYADVGGVRPAVGERLGAKTFQQIKAERDAVCDDVNHPPHYRRHPSGIECIQITEHMGFCLGNAVKYLWRADEKGAPIKDLRKAIWYIEREIKQRESQQ